VWTRLSSSASCRFSDQLFSNKLCKVLQRAGFLEHIFANLREHAVASQQIHVIFQFERRRQRPMERVNVGPPVADAVRIEVVDRLVVVVGPPRRVAETLVADYLEVGVDQRQVRVTFFDAIRLTQSVPRPVVILEPFH